MPKEKKDKQEDLFREDEKFNQINESYIVFPLFFKNKDETKYLAYYHNEKFEQVVINKKGSSFRGSVLFGFDETIKQVKGDIKLWYHLLIRNHIKIEESEYNEIFNKLLEERKDFFTGNDYDYIEHEIKDTPIAKHKWQPLD